MLQKPSRLFWSNQYGIGLTKKALDYKDFLIDQFPNAPVPTKWTWRNKFGSGLTKKVKEFFNLEKEFKKYIYMVSFDYKKIGKRGRHNIHIEARVQSPIKLSDSEVEDIAKRGVANEEFQFDAIVHDSAIEFKVKGEEVEEVEEEVEEEVKILQWSY